LISNKHTLKEKALSDKPTACTRPPWWQTLARIDADKLKLLEAFRQSLRLGKGKKG
jgi:hypothetical protein